MTYRSLMSFDQGEGACFPPSKTVAFYREKWHYAYATTPRFSPREMNEILCYMRFPFNYAP